MSRRRSKTLPARPETNPLPATEPQPSRSAATPPVRGWRRILFRGLLAVVIPAALLGATEAGLRLAGYGTPTAFFLREPGKNEVRTNGRFGGWFRSLAAPSTLYPARLLTPKPPGTKRVFVLGESAAQGTPAPAFGFVRILDSMLRQQYPTQRLEVVNAAMRGINSHVLRHIAADCAAQQPDLLVVYMGNNEATGLYAPEPTGLNVAALGAWLPALEWVRQTRCGQLVADLARRLRASEPNATSPDMAFFRGKRMAPDHPRRRAVYQNFRNNLAAICRIARNAQAQVILATVAVNLRDFPPLGSLHHTDLTAADRTAWEHLLARGREAETQGEWEAALTNYQAALTIDSHHAELHFRLGRSLLARGDPTRASEHFHLARDWDALPFRADRRLNQIVRETATDPENPDLHFVDLEALLAEASPGEQGIPGFSWFHDHVHFRFAGDYWVARSLFPAVQAALALPGSGTPLPTLGESAAALAYTAWDELEVTTAMVRQTARPPFLDQLDHAARQRRLERLLEEQSRFYTQRDGSNRSLRMYTAAVRRQPGDWQVRANFGAFLMQSGRHEEAAREFEAAVEAMPIHPPLHVQYAQVLSHLGRHTDALVQLDTALRLDPTHPPALEGKRQIKGGK